MIVCHCNRICHRQIEAGCTLVMAAEPDSVPTPVQVYDALGKRPRCGGCLGLAATVIEACSRSATTECTHCPFASPEHQRPDTELTATHWSTTMPAQAEPGDWL